MNSNFSLIYTVLFCIFLLAGFSKAKAQNAIENKPLFNFKQTQASSFHKLCNFDKQFLFERLLQPDDLIFGIENNQKSISRLEFVTGSKKSNGIKIMHSQKLANIGEFNIDFKTKSSTGFFQREKRTMIYFNPSIDLFSKNKKYDVLFSFSTNKKNRELNGGIVSDSLFINSSKLNSELIPINLRQSYSVSKQKHIAVKNNFAIYQSSLIDSSFCLRSLKLKSELGYAIVKSGFYSEDRGFFENYYLDTITTKDTVGLKYLRHGIGVELRIGASNQEVLFAPYFLNGNFQYKLLDGTSYFQSYGFGAELFIRLKKRDVNIEANYEAESFEIYESAIWKFGAILSKKISNQYVVSATIGNEQDFGSILTNRYYSNNFIWHNAFEKQNRMTFIFQAEDSAKNNSMEVNFNTIDNYIYFDKDALPTQYQKGFSYWDLKFRKRLEVSSLGFIPEVLFTSINNDDVFHYPNWVISGDVYFKKELFKKKLTLTTGIKAYYFSKYFADNYMPATDEYYLQDEIKTGNYPTFDYYLKLGIKRAELFIELNHWNEGLSGKNYFLTPHYPMPGRNFLFGVKWQLLN